MPKKSKVKITKTKQKQKQKQSQKTSVVVNVGGSKRKSSRPSTTAPVARQMPSISIVTQAPQMPQYAFPSMPSQPPLGAAIQQATLGVPQAPIQQYNDMLRQMQELRREQTRTGSLISRMSTNFPFDIAERKAMEMEDYPAPATLIRPKSIQEEVIDDATNIDAYQDDNFTARTPIDQDFLYRANISNIAPTLGGTVEKLSQFDDEDLEDKLADETMMQTPLKIKIQDISKLLSNISSKFLANASPLKALGEAVAPSLPAVSAKPINILDVEERLPVNASPLKIKIPRTPVAREVESQLATNVMPFNEMEVEQPVRRISSPTTKEMRNRVSLIFDNDEFKIKRFMDEWREDNGIPINSKTSLSHLKKKPLKKLLSDLTTKKSSK